MFHQRSFPPKKLLVVPLTDHVGKRTLGGYRRLLGFFLAHSRLFHLFGFLYDRRRGGFLGLSLGCGCWWLLCLLYTSDAADE